MDNSEDNISKINMTAIRADWEAVIKYPLYSTRRLTDLQAILGVADVMEERLTKAFVLTTIKTEIRQLSLLRKSIKERIKDIKRRIRRIESTNERRIQAQRSARNSATILTALVETGVLADLVKQSELARSIKSVEDKKAIANARSAMAAPIIKELIAQGYPINGTPDERKQWENKYRAAQNQTGTNDEYNALLSRIDQYEQERTNETETVTTNAEVKVTEIAPGIKSIDTGDKLGSAEDWLK